MADLDALRKAGILRVFVRLVGDHDDATRALGLHLPRDLRDAQLAFHRLAAGHGDRIVVEYLVGDVDARGSSGADRQQPAVRIGAVAEILENVLLAGERRLPDPVRPLASHMGDGRGVAAGNIDRHGVAADAGERAAAFGYSGRGVVRAARAEERGALGFGRTAFEHLVECVEPRDALLELPAVVPELAQPRNDRARHHAWGELALARQQRRPALVGLADYRGPARGVGVVENMDELLLDEAALLLDDQHVGEALGEAARAGGLERPSQADLVEADAERGRPLVDAEVAQRLAYIEIGLPGGDDAEPRLPRVDQDAIETVGAREGGDRRHLRPVQPPLRLERRVGPADVEPAGRHLEILRQRDLEPRIDLDRARAFHRLGDRLEPDPASGEAGERKTVEPELQIFANVGGVQDRHHRRLKNLLALVRERRGLAAVIVPGERQHTAEFRAAGSVAVLERVGRAVDPGSLAVPDAEHAIDRGSREHVDLLAAPYGGRRQVFVQPGLETDIVSLEVPLRLPQCIVVDAERRAAIAGDEAAGIEPRVLVALALHDRQANQRLDAGKINAPGPERIFVVEANRWGCHGLVPENS